MAAMKWEIWIAPEKHALYTQALTSPEREALQSFGYEFEHAFDAVNKQNAEAYFVGWCDNMYQEDKDMIWTYKIYYKRPVNSVMLLLDVPENEKTGYWLAEQGFEVMATFESDCPIKAKRIAAKWLEGMPLTDD